MTERPDRISVAIVDDHALFREGVRGILEAQSDIVVVGEAGDSAGAVALATRARPRVVLLDVEIPGDDATMTVTRIHRASPNSQVIILSMYDGPQLLRSLVAAGIRGYLVKSVHRQELVAAGRSARGGRGGGGRDIASEREERRGGAGAAPRNLLGAGGGKPPPGPGPQHAHPIWTWRRSSPPIGDAARDVLRDVYVVNNGCT